MIYRSIIECIGQTPLVALSRLFPQGPRVIAKLEMLNPGGSVKDRPARYLIEEGIKGGTIGPGSHLVESSSGNLGIALAMLANIYGLRFTCVVDPKISRTNLRILQAFGAEIDMVTEKDEEGGYLHTRVARVRALLESLPDAVWLNQYANPRNWESHFHGEGEEIIKALGDTPLDAVVIGASTTGTILGLARRLRLRYPRLRVIAVDAAGSVIFGGQAGPRELPGIGASRKPELLDLRHIDEVVYVTDWEAANACRELVARESIFAGGSSGSVIAGVRKISPTLGPDDTVLTLFADRGDRYLDTVYAEGWPGQSRRQVLNAADAHVSLAARRAAERRRSAG